MATPVSASAVVAAFKKEGIDVREVGSWRTHNRNSKGAWGPVHGIMNHHTAQSSDSGGVSICYNGRSDLPGPLCHGVVQTTGEIAMVGWGRANHAGLGDDDVLRAVIAERPLPTDNEASVDGNSRFYGFEIVNAGNGDDHYQAAQYEAVVKANAALCRLHKWDERSCIAHKEWQPGKIDPRGPITGHGEFTPSRLRTDVKACLAQAPGKWKLNAPAPTPPKPSTAIAPKSRESTATMKAQAEKALKAWPFIPEVEKKHGLTAGLLLAVGSRETNLRNVVGDGGHGHGVWQQDDRWWTVPAGFDQDVHAQAEKAAKLLADNIRAVGLAPGIAAYNAGLTGVKTAMAAGKSADSATTGGDYAADVLGRQIQMRGVAPERVLEFLPVSGYMPELHHGDDNWYVGHMQKNVNRFLKDNIATDGKYGDKTAAAVHLFYKQELDYTTKTGGRVFGADAWRRVLSVAKDDKGNNT